MESQHWMALAILAIVVIGCTGNVISFVLFSRPHMRSSSVNVLLCALSFVDFSLLVLSVPTFAIPGLDLWSTDSASYKRFMAYVLNYIYPVNLIMQTCSIYIMVMITTERWFAVCRPLQVRLWCTARKSKLAILIIFISSVAYNFVRFFEYGFDYHEGMLDFARNLRDQTKYPSYHLWYFTVMYLVTHFLVPFSLLALMNSHVIISMWRSRKARLSLTRQQQREQSTTVMLMVVTLIFVASNTLPFLLNIAECFYPNLFSDERTATIAYEINDLSNVLVVLNSATTFLIYISFSEKYRETLLFILRNGCCASSGEYNTYVAMSRTASMRYPSTASAPVFSDGHKLSVKGSPDVLIRSVKRDRSTSEYNERTRKKCKHNGGLLLKVDPAKQKKYSSIKHASPYLPEITITASEDLPSSDNLLQIVHL